MHTFNLEQDKLDLLLEGLRYLELNHPAKKDFTNLLNTIYLQCNQTLLFYPTAPKEAEVGGQKSQLI